MRSRRNLAVLSPSARRTRLGIIRQTLRHAEWLLLLLVGCSLALSPSASALTASIAGNGAPVIVQTAVGKCVSTTSATIRLPGAVAAGDDLLLVVSGQGYGGQAPVVTSVSDPVNGQWSPLVNDKSETLRGQPHLSYGVYDVAHATAAPHGLTVSVAQQGGPSAAGAVLLDVGGPVTAGQLQFQHTLQESSSQNLLTSPSVNGTAGELAIGLFGADDTHQRLSPASGWTLAAAAVNCTRVLAESQSVGTSGPLTAGVTASSRTDYIGGLVTFAYLSTTPPVPVPPLDDTDRPTITGTAQQGDTLSASNGSWTGSPSSYLYQWQDCSSSTSCANISGATSSTYTLASSDVGKTVDVVVTAANAGGAASATSAQTGTVQAALTPAPVNTAAPVISGSAQQGDTLSASNGSWSNSPSSYLYQWQDCSSSTSCASISGATSSTYTLASSDVGKTVDVVVTARNAGGAASATSAQTGTVQAALTPAPVNTAAPAISGTAQQGDTLSASNGSWSNSPTSYLYQWQDCSSSTSCANISGATSSSYTLASSDVGKTVDVVVTARNAGGSASATSAQTSAVQTPPAPVSTAAPAISGTAQQGDTLSASNGSWSNSPTSYAYQWQDCTSSSSCTNINGATSSTYTLASSDVGKTIDVVVTASNAGGSASQASAQTGTVTQPSGSQPQMTGNPTNLPAVSGNAVVGDTLSVTSGTWANSPSSYSYQWEDCVGSSCSSISGATGSSYTAQASDVGHSLGVLVTATNGSGSSTASSWNTAAVSPTSYPNGIISEDYLLAWSPPSGCSSLNVACINSRDWSAINQSTIFNFGGAGINNAPVQDATTTSSVSGAIGTSIPATVTATIPAGPIMITTDSSSPSSGSYQILQTSGAASGATSIPITGAPAANATYASGSAIMIWPVGSNTNDVPTGSAMTDDVNAIHSHGSTALIGLYSSDQWTSDCVNGYQYLLGAWFADYITTYGMDGMEIDDEQGHNSTVAACWDGIGEELHSIATADGGVPIVKADFNQSDGVPGSISTLATTKTNIDEPTFEYYGGTYDNNCSDNCQGGDTQGGIARSLAEATSAGFAAQKLMWISCPASCQANSSLETSTILGTTTTALTSGTNIGSTGTGGIPISGIAAVGTEAAGSMPAGLFILADTNSPPQNWQYLETSGVTNCTSGCTLPVTGSCTAAGWKLNTGTCTNSTTVDLNANYTNGADIYFDPIGYPAQNEIHTGGWDCGATAAYAASNNMKGVSYWYDDGSANTQLCLNTVAPFINHPQVG